MKLTYSVRGIMLVTNQLWITFLTCYDFNVFQATLGMSFRKIVVLPPVYILFRWTFCSEYLNGKVDKKNMFSEVTRFFKICVSKIFFKNLQTLKINCENYPSESLYNRKIKIFEIFTKIFSSTQNNHRQMLCRNKLSLAFWSMPLKNELLC